ncbi:NIPSNAP family protein [Vulcaniibacterium tengchongense]|uniref:NIPSNAP protein n=1 Tax=Vulcaniibacterium tengchongense TaxID=1273429 RepID=A0A3N4VAX9_9GAMM|nr:NIPSNAP family protein [Vulcaniibacterium tengchongense]RPE80142.1 NIPSNAP protein [Vulcaniibacterium tengchongense]
MSPAPARDGRHDFDFLHGRWRVRNERLRERPAGGGGWEVFAADQECRPLPGGLGNIDDFVGEGVRPRRRQRVLGLALRRYPPRLRRWGLYRAGNHDGALDAPRAGGFDQDGVGTFPGRLAHAGRPVPARCVWQRLGAHAAHWRQAFSADEGRPRETYWRMWLRRIDAAGRLRHEDGVIELRRDALRPGRREALVHLFQRGLVEPQEAVGMHGIGPFRDLDDPDRFVWLRGFPDMAARDLAGRLLRRTGLARAPRRGQRDRGRQRQRAAAPGAAGRGPGAATAAGAAGGAGIGRGPDRSRHLPARRARRAGLPGTLRARAGAAAARRRRRAAGDLRQRDGRERLPAPAGARERTGAGVADAVRRRRRAPSLRSRAGRRRGLARHGGRRAAARVAAAAATAAAGADRALRVARMSPSPRRKRRIERCRRAGDHGACAAPTACSC